jgi:HK97 family phage major capsid protein
MTPEEIAKSIDDKMDALKTQIEGAANKSDVDAIKTELDALKTAGATAEQVKGLSDKLDEIAAKQIEMETKGGQHVEKGTFVKFVEKNIADNNLNEKQSAPKNGYSARETVKVAALMTTANVIPNVAGGFNPLFGNYIDSEIGHLPKPEPVFLSLVTVKHQPGTENIYFVDRINEEGTAEFIAEGALKPLADAEYKATSLQTKEVAVRWKMTTRLMYHAPAVVADFREHANELVEQEIDDAVLLGDNTGNNMNGIVANASAFVVPTALANAYPEANIYDVIMAVATQVRLANYRGKLTAVLNTAWAALMWSIKDTEGRYIIPPFRSADGRMIGEVEIRFTNKIPATHILLGDLKKFNVVISEDAIYDEGYENDDFSKNLVSKKIESFVQGYIKQSDEGAIVYDAIADILTDIEVVPTP